MNSLVKCEICNDTGVWLAEHLDGSQVIERCDSCKKFDTDLQAAKFVKVLLYKKVE